MYVDAAPNVYGASDYVTWEEATFAAVAEGTFVKMGNGINPSNVGTTDFEIQDEVVYSFGDLGKRLTWIYWLEGETVADLSGSDRLEISLWNTWDGDGSIDGVIGLAGMAWWGAHDDNTQAALDADILAWSLVEESWDFKVKLDGTQTSITSYRAPVPEPATLLLFGVGLLGLAGFGRKKSL